jgi:hypothetical protein
MCSSGWLRRWVLIAFRLRRQADVRLEDIANHPGDCDCHIRHKAIAINRFRSWCRNQRLKAGIGPEEHKASHLKEINASEASEVRANAEGRAKVQPN